LPATGIDNEDICVAVHDGIEDDLTTIRPETTIPN
jgi:hypothetical protein